MAEKFSMLIVVVDLDCHKCYNKIRKILCELQYHERIQTISFDDESKAITIVGTFDPLRLACKLRCKGGKVVRDVHIVDTKPPPPPPPPPPQPTPTTVPPPRPTPPPPPRPTPTTVKIPSCPTPPVGPCGCPCCAPCYQGYYESCRCCCCGRVYGLTVRPLPTPCGYRGCRTFCDDDPSAACSIM